MPVKQCIPREDSQCPAIDSNVLCSGKKVQGKEDDGEKKNVRMHCGGV